MKVPKIIRAAMLMLMFVFASGFSLGDFITDTLSGQEYNRTYKEEYRKARNRGMTDREADAYARQKAEEAAARRKQMIEGAGAVASSGSEMDYDSEMTIGQSLALEGFRRYGTPVRNEALQKYVNTLGNAIAKNSVRPNIPYYFAVIESPLYNAFACPGGIIFVSSTLIKSLESEAQLAAILAHEISHAGHKHALKSIRRARFFEGVGKITASSMKGDKGKQYQSMIGDMQNVLFDKGLDKDMEFEADLSGMAAAYRTGYDPGAMIEVLSILKNKEGTSTKKGSWYSTHPPLNDRIEKCRADMKKYPKAAKMAREEKRFSTFR